MSKLIPTLAAAAAACACAVALAQAVDASLLLGEDSGSFVLSQMPAAGDATRTGVRHEALSARSDPVEASLTGEDSGSFAISRALTQPAPAHPTLYAGSKED